MRYLIILLLFPMYCNAQYPIYTEFNGGVGITYERDALPTIALVAGKMFPMGDYSFVDLQAGLAYESIFTGKVGVGSWFGDNEAFSIQGGIRLYPVALYFNAMLGEPNRMQMLFSAEMGGATKWATNFIGMFNMGIRIPFNCKKNG